MNKKGFTLVEMLVVVGLIAILSTVVGVNVVGMLNDQRTNEQNAFKKKIEDAACIYADLSANKSRCTSGCNLTIGDLISSGLIAEDLMDSKNGVIVGSEKNKSITIIYPNGEKTCTYNE